jgi:DUSP domain
LSFLKEWAHHITEYKRDQEDAMSPSSQQIQSNLSAILPVAEACHILGKDTVARVLKSFVQFRSPQRQTSNDSVSIFLKALFFDPGENDVPQNIMNNWNQLTRRSAGLEKEQFLKFMIPSAAAPYNAPGGHSGLYDCWFYALSDAGSKSGSNANAPNPVVLLPDILIVVAICREYKTIQALTRSDSPTESLDSRADYASMMLSVLAFRLYDSFQKKGVVVRDTLHRFLSDVHGDDCYKATAIRKILDIMYEAPGNSEKSGSSFLPTLNASQFANGVAKTSRNRHHILLDWIATLGDNMIPIIPLSQSINSYLDALSASNRSLESLCETFSLANLYEIKRRFHSLVETNRVVQGDIIRETQDDDEKKPFRKPRHVISQDVFVNYITKPNDEMGHGGHLPSSLAQRIFQTGSCPSVDDDSSSKFWALFDVLQFGCDAVRQPGDKVRGDITAELPLMRFLFKTFAFSNNVNRALTRNQIGEMILLLIEHQFYRLEADRPTMEDDKNERFFPLEKKDIVEESLVHVSIVMMLAISLPNNSKEEWISVSTLVDSCLDSVGVEGHELDFESFCKWHYCKDPSGLPFSQRRFGPLLMELKLIASIFFGIPPTKASLEEALVLEVQRRHKSRYPQTETSRRGPRGTIWYILEDKWYKRWVSHVHRVMGNDNDIQDGRGVVGSSARNLGKINNTLLLADDGSLALKPDIRWKHDYEIIPPMVWSALHAWYDGGPPIYRTVAKYVPSHGPPSVHSRSPRIRTDFEIELYPLFVTVFMCDASSKGEARPFQQYAPVSRVSPVGVVLVQLCKGLDVDPKLGRLWMMETGTDDLSGLINLDGPEDWLLNLELNIIEQRMRRSGNFDASPSTKIRLLLEIKDTKTGKWPRGLDGKSGIFADRKRLGELSRTPGEPDIGNGIVGLYNMG